MNKPQAVVTNRPQALEEVFRQIALTRMADMPLCNPALVVEAVGFRAWEGKQVGVLVTPWAVNLMVLPASDAEFRHLRIDERQTWIFPSGPLECMGNEEPGCGPYQFCSLFSPAFEFATQADAVATAQAVMDELFRAPPPPPTQLPPSADALAASRRRFLFGRASA